MPKAGGTASASPFTNQEINFWQDVRSKPDPWAWEQLFFIEDRDRPGRLLPWKLNAGQRLIEAQIRRMLDLNLQLQIDAWKQGEPTYIDSHVLEAHVKTGLQIFDYQIGLELLIGKSRRGGFSTYSLGKGFKRIATVNNYSALLMAHADDSAQDIWGIAQRFFKHWPQEWIRLRPPDKYNSTDYFEFDQLESRYAISTAGKNAENEAKRGWKFDFYHFSEYAHYKSYADVSQCMSARMPYSWVIKESTANGKSGPFYDEWQTALTIDEAEAAYKAKDFTTLSKWGAPGAYKFFFSWLDDPGLVRPVYEGEHEVIEASLDDYEKAMIAKDARFTLGRVKERRARIANSEHHPKLSPVQLFSQEFPATPDEMFQVSGSPVFNQERVELMAVQAPQPLLYARLAATVTPIRVVPAGSDLRIFERPKKDRAYIIGADIAKGVGLDYSVAWVADRCDGTRLDEVAMFRSNTVDEREFGHILVLLAELYGDAFLVPEINQGLLTCATIVRDCAYWNIYERQSHDLVNIDPGGGNTFRYGFFTTAQTKSMIVQLARSMVEDRLLRVVSQELLAEMRIFEVDPETNRYGVPKGEHDDGVMAMCLGVHGTRHAPRLDAAVERARAKAKVTPAEVSAYERSIFEAISKKKERDIRSAARGSEHRPALK